jgi:hypothetical protein
MTITFPAEALQRIAYAVNVAVVNKLDPITIDRKNMPWLSAINKRKDSSGLAGSAGPIVKLKVNGGLDLQGFERRDQLIFGESNIELSLQYPYSNVHEGLEIVHDDLENMGYVVTPNGPRGSKNFAKKLSEDDANRLVDYLSEQVEDMYDNFDVKMDQLLLTDNAADPKLPQGLDNYMPIANTTGTIGGQSRTNPLLQHFVSTGMTYIAAGTARTVLTQARRTANLNARGRTIGSSGIDFIMAGAGALDRYVSFCVANNIQFTTQISDKNRSIDIGIPDSGITFEGIPVVHNPSFEVLDTLNPGLAQPWTRRMYLINSKTWKLLVAPGKDKFFSAPMDEADYRISRLSLDSKLVLAALCPNANALVTFAA